MSKTVESLKELTKKAQEKIDFALKTNQKMDAQYWAGKRDTYIEIIQSLSDKT